MGGSAESMSRLRWRCRRGMLELDLLLLGFLDKGFEQLDAGRREAFVRLLELPDQTLHDYLMGNVAIREKEFADVVERIRRAVTH